MKLLELFNSVQFENKEFQKLWDDVKNKKSFEARIFLWKESQKQEDQLPKGFFSSGKEFSYLPIEFMKEDQSFFLKKELVENYEKCFLSSGTTSKDRSKSYFSRDGLLFYKLASLKTFYDLLGEFFPKEKLMFFQGISFIPDTKTWKTSSLAQMIEWFSEFWSLKYEDHLNFFPEKTDKPLWIFATALQLKDLIDQNRKIPLPEDSLVIETGGLKSSKESFSREELFSGLSEIFSIKSSQIVSEYSMCELSCQAYDFSKDEKKIENRAYRFPSWVNVAVAKPLGLFSAEGEGCLVVDDPLRVDYPFGLRVQDMAKLSFSSEFSLKGRVPSSSLKGCSLLVEEFLSSSFIKQKIYFTHSSSLNKKLRGKKFLSQEKIEEIYIFLKEFFEQKVVLDLMQKEFFSKKLVTDAVSDLIGFFPRELKAWESILPYQTQKSLSRWLLVLPNNHAFAIFYPFLFAFFSGIELDVRLSRVYDKDSLVGMFLSAFKRQFKYSFNLFPPALRVPDGIDTSLYEGVMAYGSDETYQILKPHVECSLLFYGSTLAVSLVSLLSKENIKNAVRDSLALGQKGCFSSRVLFCLSSEEEFEKNKSSVFEFFKESFEDEYAFSLSQAMSLACDHERVRFLRKKGAIDFYWQDSRNPLVLFYKSQEDRSLDYFLSSSPFVIPVVFSSLEKFKKLLEKEKSVKKLSLSETLFSLFKEERNYDSTQLSLLGSLNKTLWDGNHQGKSLFKL